MFSAWRRDEELSAASKHGNHAKAVAWQHKLLPLNIKAAHGDHAFCLMCSSRVLMELPSLFKQKESPDAGSHQDFFFFFVKKLFEYSQGLKVIKKKNICTIAYTFSKCS